ncbi:MAG: hypothetical protein ACRDV9_13240 [Acidimicrobiia bacterium]
MGPSDFLLLAVLGFVGFRLFDVARASVQGRAHVLELVGGLRVRHFVLAVPALVGVVGTASLLYQIPLMRFGWWSAIGGQGNPILGVTSTESTSQLPFLDLLPVVFVSLLILGLPLLVEGEEHVFRRGAETRSRPQNALRALVFGLSHALIGVPLAAATALAVGGVYLTAAYLWAWRKTGSATAALAESTRAHLAYNVVIVGIVGALLLLGF